LGWISVDDAAQYLVFVLTFQTFGIFGTRVIDPFAAPVANAMGFLVQTITIARLQSLFLTIDGGFAGVGFLGHWCTDWRWIGLGLFFFGFGGQTAGYVSVEDCAEDNQTDFHFSRFV